MLAAVRRSMDPPTVDGSAALPGVLLAAILMPLMVLSTGPLTAQATPTSASRTSSTS